MPIVDLQKSARLTTTPSDPTLPPITAAELAPIIGASADLTRAGHLLATAWERVRTYAPSAPEQIHREAIVRLAGYLWGSDFGGIVSETSVADAKVEYVVNHGNAFRNSGAAGLLSSWRVRRAGAIG